ncbi:hypothetical protein UC34_15565 [Pandoraea vervacti]|uniref:4'-phosphopantetheinyl transferase domain-containing protein n=1 Tax=Pandoraea vervacti TaxID=656178 RepID=A0ABN4U6N2_9BURK|nr:4'-phosphopantetheinyl transferase superfamily protein [Pandoraea vervacti]APD11331.1 hypothetical protein UC34_15565 [Pandoraea vervacti]
MQFVNVDDGFRNPARVLARLSSDEHLRMARFHKEADRARFAVVRASLRDALGKALAAPPGDVAFEVDANGRPRLAGGGPPDFNVSHAGQWGLLAHSPDVRVGVDIERLDAVADPRILWGVCLHPEEQRAMLMRSLRLAGQGGGTQAVFHWIWALKEAALKALGSGVQDHLTALSLDVDAVASAASAVNGKFHDMFCAAPVGQPIAWRADEPGLAQALHAMELRLLPAPPGYAAALAWLPEG